MESAKLSVKDLQCLFALAENYMAANQSGNFIFTTDYYSTVSSDEWENIDSPEVVIGSLVDDIQELKRVKNGEIPFSSVDLDRLSSVFKAISQLINPI